MARSSVDILIRFGRLVSEAKSGHEPIALLADAAVDHVRADGAIVVEVLDGGGAAIAATRGVPESVRAWLPDGDALDASLADRLLEACGPPFATARALPLVSGGGLFGVLVLLGTKGKRFGARRLALARGLVDLAAIARSHSTQLAQVAESHAKLRATEDALQRTEKLRALGQMAAGLSHDLKNVLNPMSLHLQVVQRALARGDVDGASVSVDTIRVTVERAAEMLDRLREFSRQAPEPRLERVDLNRIADEAVAIAKPFLSSRREAALGRIRVQHGEPPRVYARPGELLSAVVNLVVNAIDATPGGGTVTLSTGASDGSAWLRVADEGPGMPPDVQRHVFEPFFTTKGTEGTGLGLSTVFACMQRHGGTVSLETAPGEGAAFTLSLPPAA